MGKTNPKWNSFRLPSTTRRLTSFLLLINKLPRANAGCCGGIRFKLEWRYHLKGLHCFSLKLLHSPQLNEISVIFFISGEGRVFCQASVTASSLQGFLTDTSGRVAWLRGCVLKRHCTVLNVLTLQRVTEPSLTFSWFPHCRPRGRGRKVWERVREHRQSQAWRADLVWFAEECGKQAHASAVHEGWGPAGWLFVVLSGPCFWFL